MGTMACLCDARSPASLAAAMEAMLRLDPAAREAMGRRARERAEREFDQQIVVDAYLEALAVKALARIVRRFGGAAPAGSAARLPALCDRRCSRARRSARRAARPDRRGFRPARRGQARAGLPRRPRRPWSVLGRGRRTAAHLQSAGTRLVFLAGNHEEVLLRIIDGEAGLVPDWLRFGGAECLQSYGADPRRLRKMAPDRAIELIRAAVPAVPCRVPAHLRRHLPRRRLSVRPRRDPAGHSARRAGTVRLALDPRAVPDATAPSTASSSSTAIPSARQCEERANRIGIDTGAYRTGVLTAVALEGTDRWFLEARGDSANFIEPPRNPPISSALDGVSSQSG